MKKFLCLFVFLLAGCKATSKNLIKKLSKEYEKIEEYRVDGSIVVYHDEANTEYSFETSAKNDLLKVSLTNSKTNTKQIIVKNNDGVYVLSPLTNKTYKFPSDWPSESKTPYVLSSLMNEIFKQDSIDKIEESNNEFIIKFKSNSNLGNGEKEVHLNSKLLPTNVLINDSNGNLKCRVNFNEFNLKPNLNENDFKIDANMTSLILEIGEGFENREFSLPTYSLENVNKTQKTLDNAIVVNYTGDYNYTIYQKKVAYQDTNTIFRSYDDVVLLNDAVGLIRDNSLMWCIGGIEYSIYSDSLEVVQMINIANSIV